MELNTSVLSLFDTTKESRQSFCIDLISRLENGEAEPLNIHLQVKSMEDLIKQLTENKVYKSLVLDAAQKYGKSFEFGQSKIDIREVGVKYDYSQCNDPEICELLAKQSEIDAAVKTRQKFLQTVPAEGLDIVTQDGEVVKVYPASKTSTTSVSVTLK